MGGYRGRYLGSGEAHVLIVLFRTSAVAKTRSRKRDLSSKFSSGTSETSFNFSEIYRYFFVPSKWFFFVFCFFTEQPTYVSSRVTVIRGDSHEIFRKRGGFFFSCTLYSKYRNAEFFFSSFFPFFSLRNPLYGQMFGNSEYFFLRDFFFLGFFFFTRSR